LEAHTEPFGSERFDELRVSSRVEKLRAEILGRIGGLCYSKMLRIEDPLAPVYTSGNREGEACPPQAGFLCAVTCLRTWRKARVCPGGSVDKKEWEHHAEL
jgi:hypothetical protein